MRDRQQPTQSRHCTISKRVHSKILFSIQNHAGFHVPRRAGWDTHGLPVELQIEKKLGLNSKKAIEQYGVAQFNKECKDSVFTYIKDWEDFTDRIGYWVDKKNAYYTFDTNYIESLWHIFATVNNKGLVYKDFKVLPWCPRCGTALSSHELAQPGAYVDVKDLSVYAKFKIIGQDPSNTSGQETFIIAWTTTPVDTGRGMSALAVGEDIDYVAAEKDGEILIVAKERLEVLGEALLNDAVGQGYKVIKEMKGKELLGLSYEPLYPYLSEIISGNEKEKNG